MEGGRPGETVDRLFSVWKRRIDRPGAVTLGPIGTKQGGKAMYGIAAAPLATE